MSRKEDNTVSSNKILQNNSLFNKNIISLIILFIILVIFYSPIIFEGLTPGGIDKMASIGRTRTVRNYTDKTGETYLWNTEVFCGIPSYFKEDNNSLTIKKGLRTIGDVINWRLAWFLLGAVGILLLFNILKFPWYFSVFGSIVFLFFPHIQGLILVGHNTKIRAIMYIPIVLYSFLNFTKKKDLLSISLFILFFSGQFLTKHYQIIFYTLLLIMTVGIYKIVEWAKQKKTRSIWKSLGMFIPALGITVLMSALPLFVAGDYTPHSTRGGNAINLNKSAKQKQNNKQEGSSGVSFEYATKWSYSPTDYLSTIIPKATGGTSQETYQGDKYQRLKGRKLPTYWGTMPFTQSSEYFGILVVILAFGGIWYYRENGFVISLSILLGFSFLLSLGKHFAPLYRLLFNYLPYFSKFRNPMMILTLINFLLVILAMYGLKGIVEDLNKKKFKTIGIISGIFGAMALIFFLVPDILSLSSAQDSRFAGRPKILEMLKNIRAEYLKMGSLRALGLIVGFFGSITLFYKKKINKLILVGIILALISVDLISFSHSIFSEAQLSDKQALENRYFRKTKFDQIMLQNNKNYEYRVFGTGQFFQSNKLAYHHQIVGGYSATKPQLIQDIIDNNLYLNQGGQKTINWEIVNMLNGKYIVSKKNFNKPFLKKLSENKRQKSKLYKNQAALPRVFFVNKIKNFGSERNVVAFMNRDTFNPDKMALTSEDIDKKSGFDTTGTAQIIDYTPNTVKIKAKTNSEAFLVLADSYYPEGWTATVDGQKTEIYQVNHMLRGLKIPAGDHKIVFDFYPQSYQTAKVVSTVSTYFVWLLLIISLIVKYREKIVGWYRDLVD